MRLAFLACLFLAAAIAVAPSSTRRSMAALPPIGNPDAGTPDASMSAGRIFFDSKAMPVPTARCAACYRFASCASGLVLRQLRGTDTDAGAAGGGGERRRRGDVDLARGGPRQGDGAAAEVDRAEGHVKRARWPSVVFVGALALGLIAYQRFEGGTHGRVAPVSLEAERVLADGRREPLPLQATVPYDAEVVLSVVTDRPATGSLVVAEESVMGTTQSSTTASIAAGRNDVARLQVKPDRPNVLSAGDHQGARRVCWVSRSGAEPAPHDVWAAVVAGKSDLLDVDCRWITFRR